MTVSASSLRIRARLVPLTLVSINLFVLLFALSIGRLEEKPTPAASLKPAPTQKPTPSPNPSPADSSYLNVTSFGARGDGVADDTAAFQAAVNAAIAAGSALYIPASAAFYRLNADGRTGRIRIQGSLRIFGDRTQETRIRAFPDTVEAGEELFLCYAGASVSFEDLTIQGPTFANGNPFDYPDGSRTSYAIQHPGPTGKLTLLRVSLSRFTTAISTQGAVVVEARDSTVSANSFGIIHKGAGEGLGGGPGTTGRLHLYNSIFRDTGSSGKPYSRLEHHVYIFYSVALHVEGCTFSNNGGYAIHCYGGDRAVPDYFRVFNSTFESDQNIAIITHPFQKSEVVGCVFRSKQAIFVRSDLDLVNSTFAGARPGEPHSPQVENYQSHAGRIVVRGCLFTGNGRALQVSSAGSDLDVQNTTFKNHEVAISGLGGPYAIRVSDNRFDQQGLSIEASGAGTIYGKFSAFPQGKLSIGSSVKWIEP